MIAVFDTNVLVAAVITEGVCARILRRARDREFELAVCRFILAELEAVLTRKFSASKREVSETIALVREAATFVVERVEAVRGVCRDPDDDNILACALAAKSNYLVTGDDDLLIVRRFHGTQIIPPRAFEILF